MEKYNDRFFFFSSSAGRMHPKWDTHTRSGFVRPYMWRYSAVSHPHLHETLFVYALAHCQGNQNERENRQAEKSDRRVYKRAIEW